MWTWKYLEQIVQDLRYALRMTAANPAFTAMAVLSLGLGIGANTAIYSFMDAILMRALPVPHPESLVIVNWHTKAFPAVAHSFNGNNFKNPKLGFSSGKYPFPAFELLRANSPVLSSIFAFNRAGRLNLLIRGQADLADGQYVSGAFFSGLGVPPAAGRLIESGDDRAGAPAVAVLSFRYAQRRFGEIAQAAGQSILVNNTPFTVAGVAAPEFYGVNPEAVSDIYLPMHTSVLLDTIPGNNPGEKYVDNNFYWVEMMGRLRPGVSMGRAQAALATVFQPFVAGTASTEKERADLPALYLQEGATGLDMLRRRYAQPLYVLMTMVGLILAIACANIANLLLARATSRRREMAVRLSLGAGRARVVRQLLTESLLLASLGGVLGLFLAKWGIRFLTLLIASGRQDFTLHATLNWNVLGVALALSLGTGLLFGLAPALQATGIDLTPALKESRAGEPGVRLHHSILRVGLSQVLVVSQIAVSLLLLVAAGLFVRTLSNLHSIELGFNRENVLLFSVNAKQAGYEDDRLVRFYDTLRTRLSAIAGVRNVSLANYALVSGSMSNTSVRIPGAPPGQNRGTSYLSVGPGFFTTMQIPILLGREIGEREIGAPQVAVVNELFAKRYFGTDNPVGRRFRLGGGDKAPDLEIIGLSKTARYNSLRQDLTPVAYVPYSQNPRSLSQVFYELRAAGDPLALTNSVREIVHQADARIPVANVLTQARQIDQTIGQELTFATLCTCFAILAVLIACVGLYGTMAYTVARRTSEIGIRMALGAERPRVVWMVLREVLALAVAGLVIGLPVAFATSRFVESFLFGMKPNDPVALSLGAGILLAAAITAGLGPARRASRIDPMVALRQE
ncbi:MAG: ABC transporter permease [Acidobacteriia bacterium]|nr:ABC transporter permease [Terriglobia bacterium]